MADIDTAYVRARLRDASGDPDLWETRAADHISDALDEIDRLRARLAEVEAEYAELMTRDQHNRAHGMHVQAENDDLRARLAEVIAERDRWERDAHNLAWSRERECEAKHAAEAALDRVLALCSEYAEMYEMPSLEREARNLAAPRGPQDEAAAEVCPHDREPDNCCQGYDSDCEGPRRDEEAAQVCGANGCSNRATGMRKSYVPGWADVPDCGMHTQRSGTARPEGSET